MDAFALPIGLAAAALFGTLNRWRGGWTPFDAVRWSHGLRRATMAVFAVLLLFVLLGHSPVVAAGALLWPLIAIGWADGQDMGHVAGSELGDLLFMTGRGLATTGGLAAGAALLSLALPPAPLFPSLYYLLAATFIGLLLGPSYWAAWRIDDWSLLSRRKRGFWPGGATSAGEVAHGVLIGTALVLIALAFPGWWP